MPATRLFISAFLLSLLVPASVSALQVERSRHELCTKADAVVIAEVTSYETLWAAGDEGGLFTRVWFAPMLPIRGTTGKATIELILPGGKSGGIEHRVEDTPERPQLDRRYLLFLLRGPNGSYRVLGGEAGAVAINDSRFSDGERYIDSLATVAACKE
ncbi:MAG: hypothetical protein VX498_09155 [Myxococcota bacterium]|nr:hypothetical protein [Myxococcota bacterium]